MFFNFFLSLAASSFSRFPFGFLAEIQLHLMAVEMGS